MMTVVFAVMIHVSSGLLLLAGAVISCTAAGSCACGCKRSAVHLYYIQRTFTTLALRARGCAMVPTLWVIMTLMK